MNVGLIDADLLDNGTRHPNLALMKISSYCQDQGHSTNLLLDYSDFLSYDKLFMARVFSFTKYPEYVLKHPNIEIGGTGFFGEKAPDLDESVEHHIPDYHLYDKFVEGEIARGIKPVRFRDYTDYSIGFATRGCFRKCAFCVNKKYDRVERHAPVREFFDPSRKHVYLWDDNILGYSKWRDVFDELAETGRRFQFRQGMDIRLMSEEKARVLASSKYIGDFIFAFDHIKDKDLIERRLRTWKRHCRKTTKLYILCAFESQDVNDIVSIFERIEVLMRYRCLPYIMRYDSYKNSRFRGLYVNLARWCNQPDFFKKKSFRQYCEANGAHSSTMEYLTDFEAKYPDVARKYFDSRYDRAPICF